MTTVIQACPRCGGEPARAANGGRLRYCSARCSWAHLRGEPERVAPACDPADPPDGRPLSAEQAAVLAAFDRLAHAAGRPPTVRELCRAVGRSLNSVQPALVRLARRGFLRRHLRYAARQWRVVRRRDGDRFLIAGEWYRFIPAGRLGETR